MTKSHRHIAEEVDQRQGRLAQEQALRTSATRSMLDAELREVLGRWVNAHVKQDDIIKTSDDLFMVARRWLA